MKKCSVLGVLTLGCMILSFIFLVVCALYPGTDLQSYALFFSMLTIMLALACALVSVIEPLLD